MRASTIDLPLSGGLPYQRVHRGLGDLLDFYTRARQYFDKRTVVELVRTDGEAFVGRIQSVKISSARSDRVWVEVTLIELDESHHFDWRHVSWMREYVL